MLNVNLLIVDKPYASNDTIENTINYIFRLNNSMHFIYGVFPPDKDKLINLYCIFHLSSALFPGIQST